MAFSTFIVQDFVSEIRKFGVARPTRFEVMIDLPYSLRTGGGKVEVGGISKRLSLRCENAVLPQLNINVAQQRIYGPNYIYPISSDYGGDSITLSFVMDRNMGLKTFFDAWLHSIVDPNTFNVSYNINSSGYREYCTQIKIFQLDERDSLTYAVELVDAFPRNIGIMNLDSAALNTPHKLNVTFAYRKWKDITGEKRIKALEEQREEEGI